MSKYKVTVHFKEEVNLFPVVEEYNDRQAATQKAEAIINGGFVSKDDNNEGGRWYVSADMILKVYVHKL